jgi:hypothetical protein
LRFDSLTVSSASPMAMSKTCLASWTGSRGRLGTKRVCHRPGYRSTPSDFKLIHDRALAPISISREGAGFVDGFLAAACCLFVILSVVSASRSGALTESKDPAAPGVITSASGSSPRALRSLYFENSLAVHLGACSIGVLRLRGCFAWREAATTLRMTGLL